MFDRSLNPSEDERRHDQRAYAIARPPSQPEPTKVAPGRRAPETKTDRANGGAGYDAGEG